MVDDNDTMCSILFAAQDLPGAQKGDFIKVFPFSAQWGTSEVLPKFCIVRLSDVGVAEAKAYTQRWIKIYEYSYQDMEAQVRGETVQFWRCEIQVDRTKVSASLLNEGFPDTLESYLYDQEAKYTDAHFRVQSITKKDIDGKQVAVKAVVFISKELAPQAQDLGRLRTELNDTCGMVSVTKQHYLRAAAIDSIVADGGDVTSEAKDVIPHVRNRLDE